MSKVATRLLSLILMLQSRPIWKAGELSSELNVSERTVHRYMGMLDEMGIPIYSERGPHGGFSLMRGYKLPPLIFSAEEATVLYMGANLMREVLGQTYADAVTAVTAKLDVVLPDDLRQEVERARERLVVGALLSRDYTAWESIIHVLRRCLSDQRCVRIRYRGFRQVDSERVVEPLALSLQWGMWYLVAFCRLRDAMRTFRVDRIQEAVPLDEPFERPPEFSVREYLAANMRFERPYRVEVWLSPEVAPSVRERHEHWMTLCDHPDGSITASFDTASLDWATGWILWQGAHARVIRPDALVERVKTAAQGILDRYN